MTPKKMRKYFRSLSWDGNDYLQSLLAKSIESDDTNIATKLGHWLQGCVNRAWAGADIMDGATGIVPFNPLLIIDTHQTVIADSMFEYLLPSSIATTGRFLFAHRNVYETYATNELACIVRGTHPRNFASQLRKELYRQTTEHALPFIMSFIVIVNEEEGINVNEFDSDEYIYIQAKSIEDMLMSRGRVNSVWSQVVNMNG
jgi:hypothetical protein